MKTSKLFQLLEQHQEKSLLFEYEAGCLVGANYHITEVKHVKIDAVDCGAGTDAWNETVIQLWESPSELDQTEFMTVSKALSILHKVGEIKNYDSGAEVKFEYGNENFHTAQLYVNDYETVNGNFLIKLAENPTLCKARETCGVNDKESQEITKNAREGACC